MIAIYHQKSYRASELINGRYKLWTYKSDHEFDIFSKINSQITIYYKYVSVSEIEELLSVDFYVVFQDNKYQIDTKLNDTEIIICQSKRDLALKSNGWYQGPEDLWYKKVNLCDCQTIIIRKYDYIKENPIETEISLEEFSEYWDFFVSDLNC